jgi:hypothetical protein
LEKEARRIWKKSVEEMPTNKGSIWGVFYMRSEALYTNFWGGI